MFNKYKNMKRTIIIDTTNNKKDKVEAVKDDRQRVEVQLDIRKDDVMWNAKTLVRKPRLVSKKFNVVADLGDEETLNLLSFARYVVAGHDALTTIAVAQSKS